tara:strand:- start:2570 stop:3106 length:537 start_codon:yes stop_codon:yes gene_type:complete
MSSGSQSVDQSEIRLMGLILMQSLNVGLAIGVFNAGIWIDLESTMLNAFTYAMGAFFVQGIAYYFFKMFFQQGMDDKARQSEMERERRNRYRAMEMTFERRRQDMELRMQEAQLEQELRWMENNPGKMPPMSLSDPISLDTGNFNPEKGDKTLSLGVSFDEEKPVVNRGADGKFKKKE